MWLPKKCFTCGTKVEKEKEDSGELRCPNCYDHYYEADFWVDEE